MHILAAVGVLVFASACDLIESYARGAASVGPPDRFVTAVVDRGPIRDIVPAVGRIRAAGQVEVGAEVSGRLVEVLVDFDDPVEAGQLLARIDPAPFETALARAEASLLDARAAYDQAGARLGQAEAELARLAQLSGRGTISQAEIQSQQFRVAELSAAQRQAQARVVLSRTQVEEAGINLGRTEIRAPIAGFVLERRIEAGQTVNAGFSTPVLFVVAADLQQVVVEAEVAEADVGRVEPGMQARFSVDAYPGEMLFGVAGPVRRAPRAQGRFVTYLVEIEARDSRRRLLPGMTASIEFVAAEAFDALRLPRESLRPTMTEAFIELINEASLPEGLLERLPPPGQGRAGSIRGSLAGSAMARGANVIHPVDGAGFGWAYVRLGPEDDDYVAVLEVVEGRLEAGDRVFVYERPPGAPTP
ncbi:MAG: efflux RND transporter periplasmic adaptor subunit [Oceanicaulis sp.]